MAQSKIDPKHERPMLRPSDIEMRVKSHMAQLETLRHTKNQRLADKLAGHIEEALAIGRIRHPNPNREKQAHSEVMQEPPSVIPVGLGELVGPCPGDDGACSEPMADPLS